jgi:arylsulfatase A-like enzyme
MDSYRIPVLFYAPKILPHGLRVASLGSQIDVAPTIMGILRESYASEFFGHDLLAEGRPERALMSHNRDVALLRGDHMAVLGLQSSVELWHRDSLTGDFSSMPLDADTSLVNDAIGIYQSAYYLYKNRSLHPLPQPKPVAMRTM